MVDSTKFLGQLDSLLQEYQHLRARSQYDDLSDLEADAGVLANRLQAAIDRIAQPGSAYLKRADAKRNEPYYVRTLELYAIATALRDDLQEGWLESVAELVHADTFSEYLDMADELLSKKYKDPAAVIAGTSLEVHLRSLCAKHSLPTEVDGASLKADTLNAELKRADVYNQLQLKQVTEWLDLRNRAAHGDYAAYDALQVKHLIEGVRNFILKYPA